MNLFNAFQAVALYSLLPLVIQYCTINNHTGYFYLASIAMVVSYIAMSFAVYESAK